MTALDDALSSLGELAENKPSLAKPIGQLFGSVTEDGVTRIDTHGMTGSNPRLTAQTVEAPALARFQQHLPGTLASLNAAGATDAVVALQTVQAEVGRFKSEVGAATFDHHIATGSRINAAGDSLGALKKVDPGRHAGELGALTSAVSHLKANPNEAGAAERVAQAASAFGQKGGAEAAQAVHGALSPLQEHYSQLKPAAPALNLEGPKVTADDAYRRSVNLGSAEAVKNHVLVAGAMTMTSHDNAVIFNMTTQDTFARMAGDGPISAHKMGEIQQAIVKDSAAMAEKTGFGIDTAHLKEQIHQTFDAAGQSYTAELKTSLAKGGEAGKALADKLPAKPGSIADVGVELANLTKMAEQNGGKLALDTARQAIDAAAGDVKAGVRGFAHAAAEAEGGVGHAFNRVMRNAGKMLPAIGIAVAGATAAAGVAEAHEAHQKGEINGAQMAAIAVGHAANTAGAVGSFVTGEASSEAIRAAQQQAGVPEKFRVDTLRTSVAALGKAIVSDPRANTPEGQRLAGLEERDKENQRVMASPQASKAADLLQGPADKLTPDQQKDKGAIDTAEAKIAGASPVGERFKDFTPRRQAEMDYNKAVADFVRKNGGEVDKAPAATAAAASAEPAKEKKADPRQAMLDGFEPPKGVSAPREVDPHEKDNPQGSARLAANNRQHSQEAGRA